MSTLESPDMQVVVVETELLFSLAELSRACGVDVTTVEALVHEGVLPVQGDSPTQWRFNGSILPRARKATRLSLDLELGAAGAALVLELLDEIATLKAQLRRG